jgi:hypothetical protein
MSLYIAGSKYVARDTANNKTCGIKKGSQCWVTFVAADQVSFYAERTPPLGSGWFEGRAHKDVFAANFLPDRLAGRNAAYARGRASLKRYPEDCRA